MKSVYFGFYLKKALLCYMLSLCAQGWAHLDSESPKISCATLFQTLRSKIKKTGFADSYTESVMFHQKTVFKESTLKDSSGNEYWVFQKKAEQWSSDAHTTGFDPQGDPRWFLELIGPDLSHVWGFYWDGGNRLQMPTPKTWASRLESLSSSLASLGYEPLPIGFHQNEHLGEQTQKVVLSKYLKLFYQNAKIPLASQGIPYLHDMSFHSGAVALKPAYVRFLRARVEYLSEFANFLKKHSEKYQKDQPKISAEMLDLQKKLQAFLVTSIDNATGLVNPAIADLQLGEYKKETFDGVMEDSNDFAKSLYGWIFVKEEMSSAQELEARMLKKLNLSATGKSIAEAGLFLDWLDQFHASFETSFEGFDPFLLNGVSYEDFCKSLSVRRQELREGSQALKEQYSMSPLEFQIQKEQKSMPIQRKPFWFFWKS